MLAVASQPTLDTGVSSPSFAALQVSPTGWSMRMLYVASCDGASLTLTLFMALLLCTRVCVCLRLSQPSSLLDASVRSYLVYKLSQEAAFIGRADLLDAAINEYVRFMCLIRRQQVQAMSTGSQDGAHSLPLSPSRLVDLVWHAHILHTREYVAMCANHFDAKFVHHVPSTGPKNGAEREQARQSYVHTLAAYEQCFGVKAPADLWPDRSVAAAADDDDCSPAACHGSPEDDCNANCQER